MIGEWSAGKGHTFRKVDTKKYRDNHDLIFSKEKPRNLFLDDSRWPEDICWLSYDHAAKDWIIVRTYDQFVEAVNAYKFDVISFDHDLDPTATFECIRCMSSNVAYDYRKVKEKTGRECAQYLKDKYEKEGRDIPQYTVHSLNPKGTENIISILGPEKLLSKVEDALVINKSDEVLGMIRLNK